MKHSKRTFVQKYFFDPLKAITMRFGSIINKCPPKGKTFKSPQTQDHPWPKRLGLVKKTIKPSTHPKGPQHSETKTFNHPRR